MLINAGNLSLLFEGFNTSFNNGFGEAPSNFDAIAMTIPSSARETTYGWLGQVPSIREWLGDRVVKNLALHSYKILNKDFESTIAVSRNDIEDDQYGVLGPLFQDMGRTCKVHPDQLVFALLAAGFATPCYDGANFFDTVHPVLDENGAPQPVSNMVDGDGPAWFLFDSSRPIRPLIYQSRKPYKFVAKTLETDDNVFSRKEYVYGVDARANVGFGLWQMAYGSKATLLDTSYRDARTAMHTLRGDEGRPLGIMPDTLVVPPELEEAGLTILNAERNAAGATNVWKGTAKLIVTPWLA
jgi:phage major head subunit gpT-like protein